MGLLDRIPLRSETKTAARSSAPPRDETFTTKALRKFLAALTARESPALVDLGPVVGSNVAFFGEQLNCKIFVEDIFADVDRHGRASGTESLAEVFGRRFPQADASVDGILCWDLFDYLDRASAQALAAQLTRMLRPGGVLLGFFGTGQAGDGACFAKFTIVNDVTLAGKPYGDVRGRTASLPNRDIIRLFAGLRVSDSFLLLNNLREIMFRKAADIGLEAEG